MNPIPFGGSLVESRPGFPLSLEQIEERTGKLPDGTSRKETRKSRIYRDSEGRVRLETGENPLIIDIFDPVGGLAIHLDMSSKVAHRMHVTGVGVTVAGALLVAPDSNPKIEMAGQRTIEGIAFLRRTRHSGTGNGPVNNRRRRTLDFTRNGACRSG